MSERDMRSLIALLEKQIGISWADITEWLRSQNSLDAIEQKLVTGRIEDVLADVQVAAEKFAADLHHAYLESGRRAAAWLDSKVADTMIHFDASAAEVVAAARRNTLEQVAGLTQEARDTMYQALVEGAQSGASYRERARRVRDGIGLTPQQEKWQANYRGYLERGEWSNALGHELSSGHVDRTVRRLQRDGGSMTPAQIDRAVEERRANAVNQRAETIARTESLRAAHEGASDAMEQAIRRGDVDADQLVKEWMPGPNTKYARKDHQEMGRRGPIPFRSDYILPDGTRMKHPGDPRGGAKHCTCCRCTEAVTFQSLD